MFGPRLLGLALILPSAVFGAELEDFHWREDFATVERWAAQPTWLASPSPTASVASDGQAACFRVDEPGKGMKWSLSIPMVSLAETPWLVVRYRAENLLTRSDDYLLYLDDHVEGRQLHALRLSEAVADGQWHVAAVDVSALTSAEAIYGVAVQVQATERGSARLWLDWLTFAEAPPERAEIPRRAAQPPSAARPDWVAPLAQATWGHHVGWLSNPASEGRHSVERRGDATVFRVAEPSKGMKWSWDLNVAQPPSAVFLAGHRYVSMRYRAMGLRPAGDYALCVLGKPRTAGLDYTAIISDTDLITDGRWHTLAVDIRQAAARFPTIGALAIQVQAAAFTAEGGCATLEVADIRLVNAIQPSRLADALHWQPGARFEGFQPIPLGDAAKSDLAPWLRRLHLADWFTAAEITAQGIPFRLGAGDARPPAEKMGPMGLMGRMGPVRPIGPIGPIRPMGPISSSLSATGIRAKGDLRFPCDLRASEVYLLLLAAFVGPEEPVYGGGKLNAIRDLDRFRLRLEYADGTADECLPLNLATKQFGIVAGPQVLVAAADHSKPLKAILLRDSCKQAAFAVAALTARTGSRPAFPEAAEDTAPLRPSSKNPLRSAREEGSWQGDFPVVSRLVNPSTGWVYLDAPTQVLNVRVDGKALPPGAFRMVEQGPDEDRREGYMLYTAPGPERVQVNACLVFMPRPFDLPVWDVGLKIDFVNSDTRPHRIALEGPRLGPYRLSDKAGDGYYLLPQRGAAFDNRPCSYQERYCGLFPVQFIDTFGPKQGCGLSFRVADRQGCAKLLFLEKKGADFTVGVRYPDVVLQPGQKLELPACAFTLHDGDWRRGLVLYRNWVRAWLKPPSPRKPWFREVFSFRQRFLWGHDPLYDAKTGEFHLEEAIEEAKREFGGIDFLHLFDWGNCGKYGRIYGRTGDYSPYDYYKGGQEALRKAIAGVRAKGVPVGLYIEGYLLEERGKLGQQYGKLWQMIGPDGKGRWWPQSTEMYVCPFVPAWREVQASTYAAKVKELDVDGMYLDEFGFAGANVDCWSKEHGHEVPGYAVVGERDCTKLVRERIEAAKKGVVLYTEESPVDVTTQFQDGSFTYAMAEARRTQTLVPLNLTRFAFPDFKTIEILVCDHPTGSWATGVKWVFFNGEALWIEGPPDWFEPETREAIRRCYRILRKHKDAFTSLEPVPLVPTEMGGVWANKFPVPGKTVYTLYNARHRTVRGEVLRIPHAEGAAYFDEWNQRPVSFRVLGGEAAIALEIGPNDVGCLVVEEKK